jgi:carboxyl-terminal processing protease
VDAVVLDLRRVTDGFLTEVINLAGLFIGSGPVVHVRGVDEGTRAYCAEGHASGWDGPLVVLTCGVNSGASEVFVGAIQDYRRGLIVGDGATCGKGTVQALFDVGQHVLPRPHSPRYGALIVSTYELYRPDGAAIQYRGVRPDVQLPSATSRLVVREADRLYALPFTQVEVQPFDKFDHLDADLRAELRRSSAARQRDSKFFQRARRQGVRLQGRNQSEAGVPCAQGDRGCSDAPVEEDDEAVDRDLWLDEALAVALDFLRTRGESEGD